MVNVSDDVLQFEVRVAAKPETIFPFLIEPAKMTRWQGTFATLDPKPGGIYRVNVTGRDISKGEFVEVTPYSRVVFTWGWEGEGHPVTAGSTTVEISLAEDGDATVVTLRHSGLIAEHRERHAEGWEKLMPRLVIAAEGGDPGPNPWADENGQ